MIPLLVLLVTLLACSPRPPQPVIPQVQPRRVVLLSLDGLAALRHEYMLVSQGYAEREGLASFAREGFSVRWAIPPNPTLTAVGHATIATGRLPQEHGIVANRFRPVGGGLGATVSGFDAPWEAKPLWAAARAQGKRVGAVTFPGCDGTDPQRQADFFMVYVNEPVAPARTVVLEHHAPEESLATPALKVLLHSGREPREVAFAWRPSAANPDAVDFQLEDGSWKVVSVGRWFPLTVRQPHPDGGTQTLGAWCLLKSLKREPFRALLYQGAFYGVEAQPRSFRELVEREAGFWPGPPDDRALAAGLQGKEGLTLEEYGQQLERFSQFFTAVTVAALRSLEFDLLLAYQPVVDEAQHALLFADPRQPGYSEGLAATSEKFLAWTYQVADRAVANLTRQLDLTKDTLVVVSDHGIHPVWVQANLHALLEREGLCRTARLEGRVVLAPDCRMWAVQGGGVAHLYLNLTASDPTGLTGQVSRERLLLRATEALSRLEADGQPAIEAVAPREQAAPWGLAHPASGDLVVFPTPGVGLGGQLESPLWVPPPYQGMHGYLNHHRSMAGVFLARGAGVPRKHLEQASLTQVAPLVAQLLGLTW
ncbi:MAG: alkaline phosphatase family protein [Thermoanaerobaculum sp.]|nr:alkaline phosphatase family protein [Thermoanaerobaculum sp.]